jgi:hypothetical protein
MKRHPILPPQTSIAGDDEATAGEARVTPLAPPPEWLRQFADGNYSALARQPAIDVEAQFWNASPRYSTVVSRPSSAQPLAQRSLAVRRAILATCLWLFFAALGVGAIRCLMG